MHRRSGAAAGQRSGLLSSSPSRICETLDAGEGDEDRLHLPALRAHDLRRTGKSSARRRRSSITASSWRASGQLPRARTGEKIVYHDPCYLGRYRGVYDEPRAVLARSGEVIDPPRARERSFCCGAGGGLAFLGEENRRARQPQSRARNWWRPGATVVGAACPFCNTMFRDALAAVSPDAATIARHRPDRRGKAS